MDHQINKIYLSIISSLDEITKKTLLNHFLINPKNGKKYSTIEQIKIHIIQSIKYRIEYSVLSDKQTNPKNDLLLLANCELWYITNLLEIVKSDSIKKNDA